VQGQGPDSPSPDTLKAGDAPPRGVALAFQLRVSLFQVLNQSLRGAGQPQAARGLRQVRFALRTGALDSALRQLDRAWRCLPDFADSLAPIYGRLLLLESRDHDAALRVLQRANHSNPDADGAGLIALALLRLNRPEDARQQLQGALRDYAVVSGGLLCHVAGEIIHHADMRAPGWVGRTPKLELIGELCAGEASNVLEIGLDGQGGFTQLLPKMPPEARRLFGFQSPHPGSNARIEVSSRGAPLLGSGLRPPSDFGLDGRAESRGRRLTGWARLGWWPRRPPRLRLEDENGFRMIPKTGRDAQLATGRWPFASDLREGGLRGNRIDISVLLPDGRWQPLPDSPVLLEPAARLAGHRPGRLPAWDANRSRRGLRAGLSQNDRLTDVIIPVYRGRDETLACIAAVLATIDNSARVVVVDDATDDIVLAEALDALAASGLITLLRNTTNLGFAASVNRALALHDTHDVVLLNSDTLVYDDWLARLRAAAYSRPAVGTVTPLSNSGSIASYPHALGAALEVGDGAALHALAASTHSGTRIAIPVGVGFCLFIRRECLREVGSLDAAVFGKGYGEETDFCLRAQGRGWSHWLAADVYVYHAGGVSFGARVTALQQRSQRLINLRHPGYDRFIASFLAQDPVHSVRRRLDERRLSSLNGRFVLLVTLAMVGGVDRFVAERCLKLRAQGLYPLVLRPARAGDSRRCELWTDALALPNLRYDIPAELAALTALLGSLELEAIEIQHFLHLDARVIEAVRALRTPYDVFVHDYAWICPRVTLIDGSGRYCGEPAVSVCQTCIRRNGSELGEVISVPALRARSATWLRRARRIIAPSADTAARLQRHFHGLEVQVEPHAARVEPPPLLLPPAGRKAVRIALIGAIGEHKGYRILLQCARDARKRQLPLEFTVIGYTEDDAPLLATGKVFITGRYSESEAPHLLRREHPDLVWLPSVWPETWCYSLDYALNAGMPVAAFDLGAIAERVRAAGGALLPLELEPRRINDRLLQFVQDSRPTVKVPRSVQTPLLRQGDGANMVLAQQGEMMMAKTPENITTQPMHEEGLSASVQVLPLPPGLYLFSVKAASPAPPRTNGQLSLPAVHVGLGPGVQSEQVEFIAGPSTHGAWLFAQGDLLVTKIKGAGATLIMSSLRAPGGEVLSIKVERLDARAEAPATTAAAPRVAEPAVNATQSSVVSSATGNGPLRIQIGAHIRSRGDLSFTDLPWAGRVAPGLWIESFSLRPLEHFSAQDIEYKALTGSGFETTWLSDEKPCGTKGMSVPLVGFAARLKPSPTAAAYDCEYSGYFQSGVTIGPLRNGAPCRSTVANDPLEGLQIRLMKRSTEVVLPVSASATNPRAASKRKANGNGNGKLTAAPKAGERSAPTDRNLSQSIPSRRPSVRRP
jgi:GT2 family glycosyltransferase/glycosyltransferase involved in cell wall biosynthesis